MNPDQLPPAPSSDPTPSATHPDPVAAPPPPKWSLRRLFGPTTAAIVGAVFSWLVIPAAIVAVLHFYVFQAYHVVGGSMQATLEPNDYLIISKLPLSLAHLGQTFGRGSVYTPARGKIIVFHYPKNPALVFVKRVVARPGEHVVIKDGHVTVFTADHPQGINPDTSYEPAGTVTLDDVDETVPSGNVFVLGDNRTPDGSFDSRQWGNLPETDIIGEAVARLLPANKLHWF